MLVLVVSVLLGSPQYDLAWAMVAILTAVALVPVIAGGHLHALGRQAADPHGAVAVMLHFAYGSNMSRRVMRRHAPNAEAVGAARLPGYRFVITANGYASVAPQRGAIVHGVLWRLTPRDRVTLDVWESVAAGEYGVEILPLDHAGRRRRALVYVARRRRVGAAKPGYMEVVIAAAREWQLPEAYIASLLQFVPKRPLGAGQRKFGEFGWT